VTTLDNEVRYRAGGPGHVESYFVRANHPSQPRAIWLKATIFAPGDGDDVAELWCIVFDGEQHRVWADKATVPVAEATFAQAIEVAGARFVLRDTGEAKGELGDCTFDLSWTRPDGPLSAPLRIFPFRVMYEAPLPKSKLLTPHPLLSLSGSIRCWGETLAVEDWLGMQGHNWGREHAHEYAWGQCNFVDADGSPSCTVEAFTGRIKLGPLTTPMFSALVVRREGKEYRFDRTFDFWRQDAQIDDMSWRLALHGPDGEAQLLMHGDPRDMACLLYRNPSGRASYCYNSKLARVELRVNPTNAEGFECTSEHGGALEFLRSEPDARFERVV
jgi:hypothetical protein